MTALTIPVGGGALAAELAGDGPPLVLLHGFSFDLGSWDAVFADLTRDHRVLRYDLRGFGRSSQPQGPYDHVADLRAAIRAAGLRRPALVGLSLGANVALRHGLESGEEAGPTILCSPGLPGHVWSEPRPPDAARAVAAASGAEAARAFWLAHPLFDSLRAAGLGAELERILSEYSGFHWREADPHLPAPSPLEALGEARFRTLILSGALDLAGYREIAEILAARLPQARLLRLEDAGHMLAMERPTAVAEAIRGFLQEPQTERSWA